MTATMTARPPSDEAEPCCSPATGELMSQADAVRLATSLKAIADPTRLRLLSLVAAQTDGEACVCEMTAPVGLTQGTVSHHLKILVDSGLLTRDQRGKWAYYALVPGSLGVLAQLVQTLAPHLAAGA